jgi:hypothetical protein
MADTVFAVGSCQSLASERTAVQQVPRRAVLPRRPEANPNAGRWNGTDANDQANMMIKMVRRDRAIVLRSSDALHLGTVSKG